MYKNFLTALVTRVNTVTGVAYRDDPTIFAWELINEPRVSHDHSGNVLQARRLCRCTLLRLRTLRLA
jgi:mannan endo-1,4-beta-mannosidase